MPSSDDAAAAPDLQYAIEHRGDNITVVSVTGYLDAHNHEAMQAVFDDLFNRGCLRLAVDLHGVSYISSAGAGVFIGALERSHEVDGRIVLIRPSTNVLEIFGMLGLTEIFRLADTLDEAIARLKAPDESGDVGA